MTGHVGDSRGDVIGYREPEQGGIERLLVEQGRARQSVGPGQRLIPALLDVLAAGTQLAAE